MDEFKNKSDEEIIDMVRKGNKDLYAYIIDRYQNKLKRYANYILRDEHKVNDVVQDSFIKAFINLNGFNIKMIFSSWIYRIVHNEVMNIINKYKKTTYLDINMDYGSNIDIEDEYVKEELIHDTHKCLGRMKPIYREIISLYYLDNKSYEEISDILRIPLGTVAIRLKRAKLIMRKICQTQMN